MFCEGLSQKINIYWKSQNVLFSIQLLSMPADVWNMLLRDWCFLFVILDMYNRTIELDMFSLWRFRKVLAQIPKNSFGRTQITFASTFGSISAKTLDTPHHIFGTPAFRKKYFQSRPRPGKRLKRPPLRKPAQDVKLKRQIPEPSQRQKSRSPKKLVLVRRRYNTIH